MRSKAPLALMEQTVMILVFALSAALCLRVFVWSSQKSKRIEARDRAAVEAQCAAELIKRCGSDGMDVDGALKAAAEEMNGVCDGGVMYVGYDGEWTPVNDGDVKYSLEAEKTNTDVAGLGLVHVSVTDKSGDVLFEIDAAWQRTEAVEQ